MSNQKLTVYYDGLCPLCSKEIQHYREKDTRNHIQFIDITLPDFDAGAHGVDPVEVNKIFHVKKPNGEFLTKVDAFMAIWETLGIFKPLHVLASKRFTRPLLDLGYICFAKFRPYLPKKECSDGSCAIK